MTTKTKIPKKVKLISLQSYCEKSTAWCLQDILHQQVQKEDLFNHPYNPMVIPDHLRKPLATKKKFSLYKFIHALLP